MGDTKDHAEYPPSSLEMFERCPGYKNRNETNEQAERGTRIHKALEQDDWSGLDADKEKPIAQTCQDFLDAIIEEHRPALPDMHIREIRLHIDLGGGLTTFGTCDRLLIYGDMAEMPDWKTGYLYVSDAEVSAQAWCYVIGAFQRFPKLNTIRFHFVIPVRDEHSFHTFERSDIPEMQLRLNTIIRKGMKVSKMFDDQKKLKALLKVLSPQPELCIYCDRQAECPALAKKAIAVAAKLRPEIQIPESVLVDPSKPADIAQLLQLAPLLEEWAKGIRGAALKVNLEQGIEIPGYMRVESTTPRGITSVLGAYNAVKSLAGITLEEFLAACGDISIVQLEELVSDAAPNGKKSKAKIALTDALRGNDVFREGSKYHYMREKKK